MGHYFSFFWVAQIGDIMEQFVDEDMLEPEIKSEKAIIKDEFQKYEIVLNCKVKVVVYARSEDDAVEKAKQNKAEKEFVWLGSESIKVMEDTDTRVVIKNIVGGMKEAIGDSKYCPACEQYKPSKGFRKDSGRGNSEELICADCYKER